MHETAQLASLVRSIAKGLVVVSDDGLSDQSGEVVIVVPADTFHGNGNVGGRDGVVTNSHVGADELGLLLREQVGTSLGAGSRELVEVLVGHLDELLVRDTTSTDQDHTIGSVVVLDVVHELGSRDITDVLAGTEDSSSERLALVSCSVEVIEDDLLNLLLNLLGLSEDDIALPLDSLLLKLGVLENVLEDVDGLGHVLVQRLGEVDGVLALFVDWALTSDDGLRGISGLRTEV